jgi:hypothetical protein
VKSWMKDLHQGQFLLIPTAPAFGILHDVRVDFLEILVPVASQSVLHVMLDMETYLIKGFSWLNWRHECSLQKRCGIITRTRNRREENVHSGVV